MACIIVNYLDMISNRYNFLHYVLYNQVVGRGVDDKR